MGIPTSTLFIPNKSDPSASSEICCSELRATTPTPCISTTVKQTPLSDRHSGTGTPFRDLMQCRQREPTPSSIYKRSQAVFAACSLALRTVLRFARFRLRLVGLLKTVESPRSSSCCASWRERCEHLRPNRFGDVAHSHWVRIVILEPIADCFLRVLYVQLPASCPWLLCINVITRDSFPFDVEEHPNTSMPFDKLGNTTRCHCHPRHVEALVRLDAGKHRARGGTFPST